MASEPVAAATVVVLRDSPSGPEVLMVRRHETADDFAGVSVFPGGLVEASDSDPNLAPPQSGFRLEAALAAVGEALAPSALRALYVAACRELFEESSLLLARGDDGTPLDVAVVERLTSLRLPLQSGEKSLKSLLARERAVLTLDGLVPLARWITPEFQRRRWDARFFLVAAPPRQIARCDGTETCEALWWLPAQALDAYRAGEHLLAPPTFRVLEELLPYGSVADAFAAARSAGPPRPILPVRLADVPCPTLVYPGDRDYPGESGAGLNRVVLDAGRWRSERSTE